MICAWEKYPLANVCELESSMSPNKRKEIASGLTSLLLEKKSYQQNFVSALKS